jgi:hypothetical protein
MEPGQAALGKDPLVLYAGKTAVEIVVLFKDSCLSQGTLGNPLATEAVQLLSAPEFDQPCHET